MTIRQKYQESRYATPIYLMLICMWQEVPYFSIGGISQMKAKKIIGTILCAAMAITALTGCSAGSGKIAAGVRPRTPRLDGHAGIQFGLVVDTGFQSHARRRYRRAGAAAAGGAFYDGERKLRTALGALRAKKMNKPFDMEADDASVALLQTAKAAIECTDPLEAEMLLSKYRLEFLESIRPADAFSDDAVFYYALRLKLLWRIARFDTGKGEQAYRNIYSSI